MVSVQLQTRSDYALQNVAVNRSDQGAENKRDTDRSVTIYCFM